MEEWKEYKLAEVCENIYSGGTPSSMKASYWNGNLPWLSSGETSQRYIYYTEKCITKEGAENSSTRYAYKGSTVIASAGQGHTRGQASMLCIDTYVNQSVLVLKPNPLIINPHFLYFNIDGRYNELRQLSDGTSTRGSLSGKILKDLQIFLPPLNEQIRIASILKSLDDKIEVNRKINENLEQQAQALFKSWFVDFEPFKDGEFVESELGMIPKGWRVDRIEDLSQKMASGGTPKSLNKDYYSGDIKWFSTKELKDSFLFDSEKHISEDALNNSSAKMFPEGTVLMAIYAAPTVGRLGILTSPATFNQAAVGIVPKDNVGSEFVYLSLLSERINLNNLASGAAQQNLNVGIVKNYIILVPEQKILDRFNRIAKGVFNLLKKNSDESRRLAILRDTLLPKLMSGELKVNEVEI